MARARCGGRGNRPRRDADVRGVRAQAEGLRPTPGQPHVHVDIAVVGGGPAGCAAAIVLARSGADVVVVERSAYESLRIGETLRPEIRLPLERLGVWDHFERGGHEPSPGILAAWGGPVPSATDFIVNPFGCGWRVDRNRFDAMLATAASHAGATVLTSTTLARCTADAGGRWDVTVDGRAFTAAFVVDAGGRSSSLSRMLGARPVVYDRMVSLVRFLDGGPADQRALIETTEHGWWYSAALPQGGAVMAFTTDGGPGVRERWDAFLAAAPHTAARAAETTAGPVRVVSANSSRLDPVGRDAWLAVGDAAAAHDPVCGLGIHWALESGIDGADAIVRGDVGAYVQDMSERFERYLTTRARYYAAEGRWPDAPFWRRRRRQPIAATMAR